MPLSLSVPPEARGSALNISKTPGTRRWAKEQERLKVAKVPKKSTKRRRDYAPPNPEQPYAGRINEARAQREQWAEQARQLSHLCRAEAANRIGISTFALRRMTDEFGLAFSVARPEQLDRLRELVALDWRIDDIARDIGWTRNDVMQRIDEHGIPRRRR